MNKKSNNSMATVIVKGCEAYTKCSCGHQVGMISWDATNSQHKGICSQCSNVLIYVSKERKLYEFPSVVEVAGKRPNIKAVERDNQIKPKI